MSSSTVIKDQWVDKLEVGSSIDYAIKYANRNKNIYNVLLDYQVSELPLEISHGPYFAYTIPNCSKVPDHTIDCAVANTNRKPIDMSEITPPVNLRDVVPCLDTGEFIIHSSMFEKSEPFKLADKCVCEITKLMREGCTCGQMERERNVR